jgi:hypothetical protein
LAEIKVGNGLTDYYPSASEALWCPLSSV